MLPPALLEALLTDHRVLGPALNRGAKVGCMLGVDVPSRTLGHARRTLTRPSGSIKSLSGRRSSSAKPSKRRLRPWTRRSTARSTPLARAIFRFAAFAFSRSRATAFCGLRASPASSFRLDRGTLLTASANGNDPSLQRLDVRFYCRRLRDVCPCRRGLVMAT